VVMEGGRIVMDGEPREVMGERALASTGVGIPPIRGPAGVMPASVEAYEAIPSPAGGDVDPRLVQPHVGRGYPSSSGITFTYLRFPPANSTRPFALA